MESLKALTNRCCLIYFIDFDLFLDAVLSFKNINIHFLELPEIFRNRCYVK